MKMVRKSYSEINKIYFITCTINNWFPLLEPKKNKELIVSYLKELSEKGLISVYAFVIMPTHLHLIWRQHKKNGKESP